MAPEQASCEPDVDHRADLYSVGLILYHALSGVKPFADVSRGALPVADHRDETTRFNEDRALRKRLAELEAQVASAPK